MKKTELGPGLNVGSEVRNDLHGACEFYTRAHTLRARTAATRPAGDFFPRAVQSAWRNRAGKTLK